MSRRGRGCRLNRIIDTPARGYGQHQIGAAWEAVFCRSVMSSRLGIPGATYVTVSAGNSFCLNTFATSFGLLWFRRRFALGMP